MQQKSTKTDVKKIQEICRQDAPFQCKLMNDRLGTWMIGGDIKHIRPSMPGCKNIDKRGDQAACKKDRECVQVTP